MKQIKHSFMINLKTINRVLRWTGWRLIVSLDQEKPQTKIGLAFWGWNRDEW